MDSIQLASIAFFLSTSFSIGQIIQDPDSVQFRIRQVESHLRVNKNSKQRFTIEERMKEYEIPGLSIAVINDYKIDWVKGYGWADKESNIPVTTETLFQAASISKSINAVGVLRLSQEGKVDLNADVNDYLTSWKFAYTDKTKGKNITLAHLLSHTAGTNVHGFYGYAKGSSLPTALQIIKGEAPANSKPVQSINEPGKKFEYSGGGVMITQLVTMDVTGIPYEQFQKTVVMDGMGMKNSFFNQPPDDLVESRLASAYRKNGTPYSVKYYLQPEQAAAGLWSNPTDLSNFVISLQLAYKGDEGELLNSQTVKQMMTPVLAKAGLGVFIETKGAHTYFSHQGSNLGYKSVYIGSLEGGNGLVVMINSDNAQILPEIINSIESVYKWPGL